MEDLKDNNLEELKNSELKEIGGGDDFLRDVFNLFGKVFGKLSTLASFEDSNAINESYVGRGM